MLNLQVNKTEESNEEFLSPESESDNDSDNNIKINKCDLVNSETLPEINKPNDKSDEVKINSDEQSNSVHIEENHTEIKSDDVVDQKDQPSETEENKEEIIEEPVMIVTGEGNGEDCDSMPYICGEEISEPVMYIWGEGLGFENDAGNSDKNDASHSVEKKTDLDTNNDPNIVQNGECSTNASVDAQSIGSPQNNDIKKSKKNAKINTTKRLLKKQCDDFIDSRDTESDSKKHCVRDSVETYSTGKSENNSNTKLQASDNESSNSEKESSLKKIVKKGSKKKIIKNNKNKKIVSRDNDNVSCDKISDNKSSILEKRKSSVSSSEHEEERHHASDEDHNSKKSIQNKTVEDSLPPKKLKLENSASENELEKRKEKAKRKGKKIRKEIEINVNSKCDIKEELLKNTSDVINNSDCSVSKTNANENVSEHVILKRKKIKVNRAKFKNRTDVHLSLDDTKGNYKNNVEDKDELKIKERDHSKTLKRSLREKLKSESLSEEDDVETETGGKRLKMKPKKIALSSRKKVEAKLRKESSSEDSEEETLYALGIFHCHSP